MLPSIFIPPSAGWRTVKKTAQQPDDHPPPRSLLPLLPLPPPLPPSLQLLLPLPLLP